jgi:hypothetical protein
MVHVADEQQMTINYPIECFQLGYDWTGGNIHTEALNFHPIFIPFFGSLGVRFQVSVFRIYDCDYLS